MNCRVFERGELTYCRPFEMVDDPNLKELMDTFAWCEDVLFTLSDGKLVDIVMYGESIGYFALCTYANEFGVDTPPVLEKGEYTDEQLATIEDRDNTYVISTFGPAI